MASSAQRMLWLSESHARAAGDPSLSNKLVTLALAERRLSRILFTHSGPRCTSAFRQSRPSCRFMLIDCKLQLPQDADSGLTCRRCANTIKSKACERESWTVPLGLLTWCIAFGARQVPVLSQRQRPVGRTVGQQAENLLSQFLKAENFLLPCILCLHRKDDAMKDEVLDEISAVTSVQPAESRLLLDMLHISCNGRYSQCAVRQWRL